MKFRDPIHAAQLLLEELKDIKGKSPVVLALPQGAMPMAKLISDHLQGELDVLLVHRFGSSSHSDYALGSVTEDGRIHACDTTVHEGIVEADLKKAASEELERLLANRRRLTPHRPSKSLDGRLVLIVDDGLASGVTLTAAIRSAKDQGSVRVLVATPAISKTTLKRVLNEGAEVCSLHYPERFFTVDEFFEVFSRVAEDEVIAILRAEERFGRSRDNYFHSETSFGKSP